MLLKFSRKLSVGTAACRNSEISFLTTGKLMKILVYISVA